MTVLTHIAEALPLLSMHCLRRPRRMSYWDELTKTIGPSLAIIWAVSKDPRCQAT